MFLKNHWYVAAMAREIGRGLLQRWVTGEPLVLYRTGDGRPVALEDRCPHRRFALSKGKLIGDVIQCGYHGLEFDCTGACVSVPGQDNIPPRLRARAYPAIEKHTWVWVWMGDPAKADEALIPDFHWNDEPGWAPVGDRLHWDANYRLLVDNLMDLTHETYVHAATIGNAAVAETPLAYKVEGRVVKVERLMKDCPAPPLFRKVRGFTGNIDRWQYIRFEPPSNIWIDAGGVPAGTNDMDQALRWYVMNAITPETERTTHYFWSVSRCFAQDDPGISALIKDQVDKTFEEDRDILETQQRLIESDDPHRPLMSVNCDAGGAAARKLISEALAAETADRS